MSRPQPKKGVCIACGAPATVKDIPGTVLHAASKGFPVNPEGLAMVEKMIDMVELCGSCAVGVQNLMPTSQREIDIVMAKETARVFGLTADMLSGGDSEKVEAPPYAPRRYGWLVVALIVIGGLIAIAILKPDLLGIE